MTMLEKAARALCEGDGTDWSDSMLDKTAPFVTSVRQEYFAQARAVLMAIREPDAAIMTDEIMQNFSDPCWREDARGGFTAMIDHILGEEK